jgi:TolB-like protein
MPSGPAGSRCGSIKAPCAAVMRGIRKFANALTGFHLWSETYDRDLKNVFALQNEIATAVTGALQATLLPAAVVAD